MSVIITNTSGSSSGAGAFVTSFVGVAAWPGGTADVYADLTSISVPAGTWSFGVNFYSDNSGVITSTEVEFGVSTTSGNSSTGLANGDTLMSTNPLSLASGAARFGSISQKVFTHASTTTYYFKVYGGGSVTNLRAGGRITAIRIA